MKKFMKVCAIMTAILLVLGGALAIMAGSVRGSRMISDVVDTVTGGRLHVNFGSWSPFWGIYWDDNVFYDLDDWNFFDSSHEILSRDVSGYEVGSDVKSLDIELGGYVFKTAVSEDDSFYVSTDHVNKMQCYVKNGTLYLKAWNSRWGIGSTTRKITLYIPEGQSFEKVEVELGAGEITLDDVTADEISLEVGAGKITAKNIRAGELEISVGAGKVDLVRMDVDVLDAEIGMGELVGSGTIRRSAELECAMGNMELRLSGSQKDFNYHLEVAAGNIDVGRNSYGGLGNEQKIQNGADKNMDIDCAMGNVTIRFED